MHLIKRPMQTQIPMYGAFTFTIIVGGKTVLLLNEITHDTHWEIPATLFMIFNWLWISGTIIYLNAVDPGFMPRFKPFGFPVKDHYNVKYKNQILPRNTCETCNLVRPLRGSHCRVCDRCVNEFDHHCGWIGNCVGERNKGRFFIFVVMVFFNSLMIWCITLYHLLYMPSGSLGNLIFIIVIFLMLSMTNLMLGMLFLSHIYLCFNGKTTYENIKMMKQKRKELKLFLKENGIEEPCKCKRCKGKKCKTNKKDEELGDDESSDDDNNNSKLTGVERRRKEMMLRRQFSMAHKNESSPYQSGFSNLIHLLFRPSPPSFI